MVATCALVLSGGCALEAPGGAEVDKLQAEVTGATPPETSPPTIGGALTAEGACPAVLRNAAESLRAHIERSSLGRLRTVPPAGAGLPRPAAPEVDTLLRSAGLAPSAPMTCVRQVLGTAGTPYWSCHIDETAGQYVTVDFGINAQGQVSVAGLARVFHAENEPRLLFCSGAQSTMLFPGRFATAAQYQALRQSLQAMLAVTGTARDQQESAVKAQFAARFLDFAGPVVRAHAAHLSVGLGSSNQGSPAEWSTETPLSAHVRLGSVILQLDVIPARTAGEGVHVVFVKRPDFIKRTLTPSAVGG